MGDPMVGKTTLRLRYLGEGFRKEYVATIGADFAVATYGNYIIQLWDLAGQINFENLTKQYHKGSQGIIFVFDITRRISMLNIPNWIDRFLQTEKEVVPMIVLGNKIDLRKESNFTIHNKEAEKYVMDLSNTYETQITYMETSGLTGHNIRTAFECLVEEIVKKRSL